MPETDVLTLGTAFLIGMLGSGHCVGMCGGILGALSVSAAPERRRGKRPDLVLLLGYNLGRILSYSAAGLIAGLIGSVFIRTHLETPLRLVAAFLLIALGLYLTGLWQGITRLEALGKHFWKRLQPLSRGLVPVRNGHQAVLLGAIWGWLPCGLVYAALAWAATAPTPLHGALTMFAFGLGTLPALLATGLFAEQFARFARHATTRAGSGLLVMAFGVWTLWGAFQHGAHSGHTEPASHPVTDPAHSHHHHHPS